MDQCNVYVMYLYAHSMNTFLSLNATSIYDHNNNAHALTTHICVHVVTVVFHSDAVTSEVVHSTSTMYERLCKE